jgi:hypothetical protein
MNRFWRWDLLTPMGWGVFFGAGLGGAGLALCQMLPVIHPIVAVFFVMWWLSMLCLWCAAMVFIIGVLR